MVNTYWLHHKTGAVKSAFEKILPIFPLQPNDVSAEVLFKKTGKKQRQEF